MSNSNKSRRKFIKDVAIVTSLSVCGVSMLQSCSPVRYVNYTLTGSKVTIKKSDFEEDQYVVVKVSHLPKPIYIAKLERDNYSALFMECTHKRCEVRPFGNELHCPCHGSEYDNLGEVISPPALYPLKKFKVSQDAENIYVD
jgi:Rieske Fe-S protein